MSPKDLDIEEQEQDFRIQPVELQEEMERSFIDYAMSVITSRAIPDVRDGLKPVHRRILWGMHEMGVRSDRPHVKSAKVTGEVMGNYHPHGDSAIYDALVRLGQDFSLRHVLIDKHGNFGSPDDPPAAARYTECRLSTLANEMLRDINENTVDEVDNYSGDRKQPVVLPARLPNLLINGGMGIAVGMASNIPPHNLGEVIDAVVYLIDNPDATPDQLMKYITGPDFPTGAQILGRQGIIDAYRTGRGSIRQRSIAEIVETKKATQIVVTEIPYQTSVSAIAIKIKELVDSKELDGIRDLDDLSSGKDTRLVITLKRDANPNVLLNNLFKHTPLQMNFSMNMVAIDHGVPRTMNLREVLVAYVDHQIEVITRRSQFRLDKARREAHILEGLIRALDMIDAIIETIRNSLDRASAKASLLEAPFSFTEVQAERILDMRLAQLTRLSRRDLEENLAKLQAMIAELEEILSDDTRLRGVIKDEITEIKQKFATPRKSEIVFDPGEMAIEDFIEDEPLVIAVTKSGYIKAMPIDAFRVQQRGGRGVQGGKLKEEDLVTHLVNTSSHAYLLFFSNKGKVYRLKAHEIPVKERTARGVALVNLIALSPGEQIQAMIETREYPEDRFLFFATKKGQVKKTTFSEYDKSRRDGFFAISLNEEDELVRVVQTSGDDDVFMVTREGMTIRFNEQEVRPMGRVAAGVRGIKLRPNDEVVSCDIAADESDILIVTSEGFGKRTKLERFNPQGRGGIGVRGIKLTLRRGYVVAAFMVALDTEVMFVSDGGVTIRVEAREISSQGREATGVRIMNLDEGHLLSSAAPIVREEEIL